MAPVYADHPFPLIRSPISLMGKEKTVWCYTYVTIPSEEANISQPDVFDICASEMSWVHNMMIRGLNSIYLQAEHIKKADEKAFCQYILHWHMLLHIHHTGEEEDFFPHVEELSGEKGIMEVNVQQHHAFHDGLEKFIEYVKSCADGTEQYDGKKVVEHIDAFGKSLTQHLSDEIPTILGLKKYGEKLSSLPQLMQAEAEKNMKKLGLFNGMPWCMVNWDVNYEDGIWKDSPPAPWFIKAFVRHIGFWVHSDWWKFAASDRQSRLQPLYAISS